MNYKLADFISNYLNEQKLLTDKYTRLFNQIKLGDSSLNRTSSSLLNLKKRSQNQDFLYNSNKEKTNCQYCGKQYTSKLPLRNHIKKFHLQDNYTSRNELSTKQSTPYDDDYDQRKQDYSRRDDSSNEADEELRQKLLRNVQAIEKRENGSESKGEKQDQEFIISGLNSDSSSDDE
ncbi:unnamed protein product [Paramecium primaurelia]|uniref:C2H2-type domain-containing protein n=2 Tax=Paramecium TaxID=5884 RepID=A0A8S1UBH6_9CILI|nr:unnamed protein product [Paramecium primaurelia]CAD8162198.1 unnamed protein product [Paramecium pentaurelia]